MIPQSPTKVNVEEQAASIQKDPIAQIIEELKQDVIVQVGEQDNYGEWDDTDRDTGRVDKVVWKGNGDYDDVWVALTPLVRLSKAREQEGSNEFISKYRGACPFGCRGLDGRSMHIETYSGVQASVRVWCGMCKASGKRLAYEVLKGYTKLVEKPLYALPKASPIDDSFLLKFSADDSGNALAVNELYGEHLLYTDAYGWLVWNDTHWKADQDRVTHFIVDTLVRRRVAAVEAGKEKVVEASRANKYRLDGCLPFLKSLVKEQVENFDSNPDELNVLNGVLNLRNGTITPHDSTQRFTYCLPVPYNPDADSSKSSGI